MQTFYFVIGVLRSVTREQPKRKETAYISREYHETLEMKRSKEEFSVPVNSETIGRYSESLYAKGQVTAPM